MPTAARLVAALLWGALAWQISQLIIPLLPEGSQIGMFVEVNVVLGLIIGWTVAGSRAGQGFSGAVGYGITASVALVVVGLFTHASVEMVYRSLEKRYRDAGEAVIGVFDLMTQFGKTMMTTDIVLTLLVGGIAAGLVTEAVNRRWR
ncbi:MAG: Fatty acid desaturase [Rhodobacteraceae bacterium HLUCCA08]|nr:MAG: Fatty acid desaturase [Rhodobacteraceae bacterium HLUCCA08]